jgi:hypothetical protein
MLALLAFQDKYWLHYINSYPHFVNTCGTETETDFFFMAHAAQQKKIVCVDARK